MKVSEQNLSRPQQRILRRLRLLHFDHQVRGFEHPGVFAYERRSRLRVIGIRVSGAGAGVPFDKHLVAAFDELVCRRWQHGHPILLSFDFFRYADDHDLVVSFG